MYMNVIALTGIVLENVFGSGFLTPLENTDAVFNLEVNHLTLSKYTSMIAEANLRDDLDLVYTRYSPKKNHLLIGLPKFDNKLFDPNKIPGTFMHG